MKITVETIQVKKLKAKVEKGQIYRGGLGYYLVAKARDSKDGVLYNLTNIADGSRWTAELTLSELENIIISDGFEVVNVKEIKIVEEI